VTVLTHCKLDPTDRLIAPRSGAWVPIYSSFAKAAGHAGTWGPGEVSQYCIHVRDVAAAVLCVLKYLLEDPRRGGSSGLCEQLCRTQASEHDLIDHCSLCDISGTNHVLA